MTKFVSCMREEWRGVDVCLIVHMRRLVKASIHTCTLCTYMFLYVRERERERERERGGGGGGEGEKINGDYYLFC